MSDRMMADGGPAESRDTVAKGSAVTEGGSKGPVRAEMTAEAVVKAGGRIGSYRRGDADNESAQAVGEAELVDDLDDAEAQDDQDTLPLSPDRCGGIQLRPDEAR